MSRAFLKDDAIEDPVMVPARAPLPPGVPNTVTPRGLRMLREERAEIDRDRAALDKMPKDSADRKRRLSMLNGRQAALDQRIATARVIDLETQPQDEVRFGASVTLRNAAGAERRLQVVGVDETDAAAGRIPFTAPVARALVGKRVGESVPMPAAGGTEPWTISVISYEGTA